MFKRVNFTVGGRSKKLHSMFRHTQDMLALRLRSEIGDYVEYRAPYVLTWYTALKCNQPKFLYLIFHHRHHVPEGLGVLSCSLILKMKLVPPPLPWSPRVPSSFWSIL